MKNRSIKANVKFFTFVTHEKIMILFQFFQGLSYKLWSELLQKDFAFAFMFLVLGIPPLYSIQLVAMVIKDWSIVNFRQ